MNDSHVHMDDESDRYMQSRIHLVSREKQAKKDEMINVPPEKMVARMEKANPVFQGASQRESF